MYSLGDPQSRTVKMPHMQVSFETPEYTANADGLGALRALEVIRMLGRESKTRFETRLGRFALSAPEAGVVGLWCAQDDGLIPLISF